MQQKNEKTKFFAQKVGITIKKLRQDKPKLSINKLAHEYDLDVGNMSRIENSLVEIKFVTLWKIAEALEIPMSEFIFELEKELGNDFKLVDLS